MNSFVKNIYSIIDRFIWDIKACCYDEIRTNRVCGSILERENQGIKLLIERISKRDAIVFDLGIGTGNDLKLLPNQFRVVGFDKNLRMLQSTRNGYSVDLVQADVLCLPVGDMTADIILMIGVSEYIREIDSMFKELARIMNPQAYAIITYSPDSMITRLRKLVGNRLIIRSKEEIESLIQLNGFMIMEMNCLKTQHQILMKKMAD